MESLISVIIPVYNAEAFLPATVRTVIAQTYRNLEIILVDDGSSDGSLSVCRALAREDPRIVVLHKENGGAGSARNCGIRASHGEYIGFVDSDDAVRPDMYAAMMEGLSRWQEGRAADAGSLPLLVQTGRIEVNERGERLPDAVTPPTQMELVGAEAFAGSLLLYTGDSSFCTKLCPASLLRDNLFEEGTLGEDFGLYMRIMDRISGVLCLPSVGYEVLHRRGSATRRRNPSQFSKAYIDIVRQADLVEKAIVPVHPCLAQAAVRFGLFERLDYMLHVPVRDMTEENAFYQSVCDYLRAHVRDTLKNPFLTGKNRLYLLLLTYAPVLTRKVHWALRGKAILQSEGGESGTKAREDRS